MLTCRVLGATEVHVGGTDVDLGGPLPRRLVAALVAAGGRPVPDDRLAAAVWGDRPPANPGTSLQVYVSRLRRSVGPAGRHLLARSGGGYRLALPAGATDAEVFTGQVAQARELLAGGRPGEALCRFGAALDLWRGEAYADLADAGADGGGAVAAARDQLHELREVATEERSAARLATGDAPGAVAELEAATRAQPYRERRWALLILGLYRCGRQGDALGALRRVRALLAEELGVDPGPELQRLERRVLAQDPHLLLPEPAPAPPTPAPPAPPAVGRPGRPLSSFLGRRAELADLAGLLTAHRLVTLVGSAGAGKTRLAVEYAAEHPGPDGSWQVRLADVAEPGLVALAVAGALGLAESADDPVAALVGAVGGRAALLVLDNCEHLVGEVADLAVCLLRSCPALRVLATSREPLGIDGETVLPVGPLPADSAVELLVDRVRAVRPGWAPTADERDQARRLAAVLDGIPLALELAAARARVHNLGELADLVRDRLAVLGPVPRGSLAPHATLDAAIGWSVDLLPPADRALLLRLWPFDGGFPLEAAEGVRPHGDRAGALQSLSSLVTRSVVVADTGVVPSRYRLLEMVRAYCEGQDPEPAASRAAHAAWVRRLVDRCAGDLRGHRSAHAVRVLARELPNLRAGIAHDLATDPPAAVRTAGLLDWFWYRGGHLAEGERLLRAALAAAPDAPAVDRGRALAAYATLRFIGGDLAAAERLLAQAEEVIGEPADVEGRTLRGQARSYRAIMRVVQGDFAGAWRDATATAAIGESVGQEWIVANAEMSTGAALIGLGRPAEGQRALVGAIDRALRCGQVWTAAMCELLLARALLAAGETGQTSPAGGGGALGLLRSALARFRDEQDVSNSLAVLHTGALALAAAGDPRRAATLRAAVRRHAVRQGLRPDTVDPTSAAALTEVLAGALDGPALAAAGAAGAALDWPAMVAFLDG